MIQVGLIQSLKGLRSTDESFPEKEFCLKIITQKSHLSS
jgi:hypothetical protein